MTQSPTTLAAVLTAFAEAIRPAADAATEAPIPSGIHTLMRRAGVDLDMVLVDPAPAVAVVQAAASAYDRVVPILEQGELDDLQTLKRLGQELVKVVQAVRQLDGLQFKPDLEDLPASVARQLLDYLVVDYLDREHPVLHGLLLLAGGITPADVIRRRPARTHPEVIAEWIRNPESAFRTVYGWGTDDFQGQLFLERLAWLLPYLGIATYVEAVDRRALQKLVGENRQQGPRWQLRIPVFRYLPPDGGAYVQAGMSLFPVPPDASGGAGLAVCPFAEGAAGAEIDLGSEWRMSMKVDGDATLQYALVARPGRIAAESLSGASLPSTQIGARLAVERRIPAEGRTPLFSAPGGLKVELGTLGLQLGWAYRDGQGEIEVVLPVKNALLAIRPPAEDGFLSRVLPADGISAGFDLALGWSSRKGLTFQGSAGLDATLPVRVSLGGVVGIDLVHVGVRADDGAIRASASATASVQLGPVSALVEQVGLETVLSFPEQGGNLGIADLAVGFKPPAGAALRIDAGAVKGGGYLFFDPERGQYAGVMELELASGIGVKAIGLITTRMPDGSRGFSMFVLITADGFAPVQLGMGFTLTGIGGMLGVNRTVNAEVLRQGLRQNILDNLLFPADPLRNAPTVISNLNSVFPPAPGRFLFGPMAVLGWGTPTLLTLKMALILELPDPVRLLMLGRLTVMLPEPKHPLIRIQLDAVGELNFQKGTVTLDGALFDSRLLEFTLTGSMALRAGWGGRPYFLLSLGGFNPRFPVPAGIPKLDRLALSLSSSENLRLRCEAYVALTSNTAQFGARVEMMVKAGDLSLDGYLGFDTLIQFAPFGFIADVAAGVALRYKKKLLAGIQLALTISGPTPWHFRGTAKFQIAFLSFTVDVDHRFGPAIPPPLPEPIDVGERLRRALVAGSNWSSELPRDAHPLVTLRRVEGDGVVAHPLARLTLRQREVPLNVRISRFGHARPKGNEREFVVQASVASGAITTRVTPVQEQFARGQFFDLTDDQRLRQPSFEPMDAGFEFGADDFAFEASQALDAWIGYETTTVDPMAAPAGALAAAATGASGGWAAASDADGAESTAMATDTVFAPESETTESKEPLF